MYVPDPVQMDGMANPKKAFLMRVWRAPALSLGQNAPTSGWTTTCACTFRAPRRPPPPQPTSSGLEPQMPGIVSNYAKFYQVKSGDSCWSIENAAGITLAQFRSWNTQIDESCTNLWVDYYVCIGV
ncbi:LysM domain-containing protein [Aspergillus fumigatus Z5]|nr:LysM domain-containing protein [Aspergillus fumigatus Z5]